jgi:ribosomal protein S18 acetylase RimI-like enzyme
VNLSVLRERIGFALSKGGLSGTAVWLMKKAFRVEPYIFFETGLEPNARTATPSRFAFHRIVSPDDLVAIDAQVQYQLNKHAGRPVERLVYTGNSVYFLADGSRVACQLNISPGPVVTIDSPRPLQIDMGDRCAFLAFLFTDPQYRRIGLASALIDAVRADLAREGYRRMLAHVRRTNVASIGAFARMGWRRVATIWVTTGPPRRIVLARLRQSAISVRTVESSGR